MRKLKYFSLISLGVSTLILSTISQANSSSQYPGIEIAQEMKQTCTIELPTSMQRLLSATQSLTNLLKREKSELNELNSYFKLSKNAKNPFVPTEDLKKIDKKLDSKLITFNRNFKEFLNNKESCYRLLLRYRLSMKQC